MKRLFPIQRCFSTSSAPLCLPSERRSFSGSSTTLLATLFSNSASFRPPTVMCRALQHRLGTARRRSAPPLNLHRAHVRRKSRAASFKSLYRKRANSPCACRRIVLRTSDTTLRLPGTYHSMPNWIISESPTTHQEIVASVGFRLCSISFSPATRLAGPAQQTGDRSAEDRNAVPHSTKPRTWSASHKPLATT